MLERGRRHLEEAFPEGRVLIGEQASGDVGVGHLQKVEVRAQLQADPLLRQQRPARAPQPHSQPSISIKWSQLRNVFLALRCYALPFLPELVLLKCSAALLLQ